MNEALLQCCETVLQHQGCKDCCTSEHTLSPSGPRRNLQLPLQSQYLLVCTLTTCSGIVTNIEGRSPHTPGTQMLALLADLAALVPLLPLAAVLLPLWMLVVARLLLLLLLLAAL